MGHLAMEATVAVDRERRVRVVDMPAAAAATPEVGDIARAVTLQILFKLDELL